MTSRANSEPFDFDCNHVLSSDFVVDTVAIGFVDSVRRFDWPERFQVLDSVHSLTNWNFRFSGSLRSRLVNRSNFGSD